MIDTSALVALERGGQGWETTLATLGDEPAVVPAIVYAELAVGALLAATSARAAARRVKIRALVANAPVVDFAEPIAEQWAQLFAHLTRAGQLIPSNDLNRGGHGAPPGLRCPRRSPGRSALPAGSRPPRGAARGRLD